MTRAEAVTVLYRLLNGRVPVQSRSMTGNTFIDVNANAWYYNELKMLWDAGFIQGYESDRFKPNQFITRAEFAIMCSRYAGLQNVFKTAFKNITADHYAYGAINVAYEDGWINGYPDGTFRPDTGIDRVEVMKLMNTLFNRIPELNQIKTIPNPYNDITSAH